MSSSVCCGDSVDLCTFLIILISINSMKIGKTLEIVKYVRLSFFELSQKFLEELMFKSLDSLYINTFHGILGKPGYSIPCFQISLFEFLEQKTPDQKKNSFIVAHP